MAAPKTVKTYPLSGTNRDFEIPFEYLARKFVVVTLIGTDRKELVLNVDYRFTQRTIITLTRVWAPEEVYYLIEIKRVTSATERLVDFSDGSILRASDLNTATVQALHIAEEGRDIATETIGVDNDGQLDARGRQIRNLADGVSDGDAVNLRQMRVFDSSALNSAQAAKASEQAAKNSEIAANGYRVAAANSAATASTQAANSSTSAGESLASSTLAERWASANENLVVSGGRYSSLHYSLKASASAAASAASAAAASGSESGAQTHAATAMNWAMKAEDSPVSGPYFSSYHYSMKALKSAQDAQGWAAGVNLPSASGQQLKMLRQKEDGTGFEYVRAIDDVLSNAKGTVGVSTGGLPTGAIYEVFTVGESRVTKYYDGTLIVESFTSPLTVNIVSSYGGIYYARAIIQYPGELFVSLDTVVPIMWITSDNRFLQPVVDKANTTEISIRIFDVGQKAAVNNITVHVRMKIIGRWRD